MSISCGRGMFVIRGLSGYMYIFLDVVLIWKRGRLFVFVIRRIEYMYVC